MTATIDQSSLVHRSRQAFLLWGIFFVLVVVFNGTIPFMLGVDLHAWTGSTIKSILFAFVFYAILFLTVPLVLIKGWQTVRQPAFLYPLCLAMLGITFWRFFPGAVAISIITLAYLHRRYDLSGYGIRSRGWKGDLLAILLMGLLGFVPAFMRPSPHPFSLGTALQTALERLFANPASSVENLFYFGFLAERLSYRTGKWLITGSDDAVARLWDLETNPPTQLFTLNFDYSTEGPPGAFAFSPDGRFLAMGAGAIAKVWNFQALQADPSISPVFTLFGHQNNTNHIVYTQDGTRLVTGNADGTAKVWDAATGQELFTQAGGTGTINSLAISVDGNHPISAHGDGQVRIWDISPTGSHESWAVYPAYRGGFSRDSTLLATAYKISEYTGETQFQLWTITPSGVTEAHTIIVNPGARVSAYGFSADLTRYATIDAKMMLQLWDPSTGNLLQSFPISQTTSSIGHTNYVFGFDFSPDGTKCAIGGADGLAYVWDLASGKVLQPINGHEGPVMGVTFSADGTRLATASDDGTARIWETATGQLLQTLSGHAGYVIQAEFSPDGKRIVTTSNDTTAKVWDILTGQELLTLKGHISSVFWVDFSPDGSRIATGSTDGTVKVWDAFTGQDLLTLPGFFVRFALDGKSVMAISLIERSRAVFTWMHRT